MWRSKELKICDGVHNSDEITDELCSAKVFSEDSGDECDLHGFFLQTKKEERDLKMVNWNEAEEKDLT